ncbi:MAG: PEP-CTERM sorting domain-containing protein [Verrucomicrobiota bacterium]
MKRALSILVTVGMMLPELALLTNAAPINGSFESGSFSGWQLGIATGQSYSQRGYRAAGTASVVSSWGQPDGFPSPRYATDGNRFAMLGTQANGNFTGHRTYDISLHQELSLTAGTILSGWSFFFNGDNQTQDSAWVKILDEAGETIATPWLEKSGCAPGNNPATTAYRSASPWTPWSWQTPANGSYTLSFGMTTADDNNFASYGFFDGFLVTPPTLPVPEPTTLTLVVLGAAGLWQHRRTTTPTRN